MGLFDSLFGKKLKFEVRVFANEEAKFIDLANKVREDAQAGLASLILHHFAECEAKLLETFPEANQLSEINRGDLGALRGINLLSVHNIPASFGTSRREDTRRDDVSLQIHLAERFPACGPDEIVLHLADFATPKRPCINYVHLDEAWLSPFLGKTKDLLKRLDWDEAECLSGSMLSSSIDNAQKKLTKERPKPWLPADSAAEWMEKNAKRT